MENWIIKAIFYSTLPCFVTSWFEAEQPLFISSAVFIGLPRGSDSKEASGSTGDLGLIGGWGVEQGGWGCDESRSISNTKLV